MSNRPKSKLRPPLTNTTRNQIYQSCVTMPCFFLLLSSPLFSTLYYHDPSNDDYA